MARLRYQLPGIIFCLTVLRLGAQSLIVYPGDVTNNGVVNNLDFLHLGIAYNYAGPPRDSALSVFTPQQATPWMYSFADGRNLAYADCNGDGFVNYYYDAFPLYTNYGLQRSGNVTPDVFIAGLQGVDPPLRFDHAAAPASVGGGQLITLPVELGSAALPAEDVYGVAFSLYFDPALIEPNSVMFNFNETSWANPDNDRIWMYKKVANNRVDVAWVRTDRNQKNGFGRIGYLDFVIVVDIIPYQSQQFPMELRDMKLMDKFGNYATVAGDTLWLTVPSDSALSGAHAPLREPRVSIMPNPATTEVLLHCAEEMERVRLTDLLGKLVLDKDVQGTEAMLNLQALPDGIYQLRIETEHGTAFSKLEIAN